MKNFQTLTMVLFLSLFIFGESSGIRQSQANLIKDLYNKYTNKIGYEDLIIGASSNIINKHCSVGDVPGQLRWDYNEYYRCYNSKDWDFFFDIKQNKISRIRMANNDKELSLYELKPIINSLDKKYKLDGDPEVSINNSGKYADGTITTSYSFAKGGVLLYHTDYSPSELYTIGTVTVLTYQQIYSDARF